MLAELETGLVALIKASALDRRVRLVDSLPDLAGDSLVGRFVSDAPAVYVALGSFPVVSGYARIKFGIACVARNSRSHQAARHGDGVVIGLHEMLDAVMTLADGATVGAGDDAVSFEVISCDQIASEALYQKGIYAGAVQIQSSADVALPALLSNLSDFKTFHADYDVEPHQASSEHTKWLKEPADHSTSAPELSGTLKLQE
jgi:hypothetical protein